MIRDGAVLDDVRAAWKTVRVAQSMVTTNLNMAGFVMGAFRNFAHSLVLLFAYSVLENVLEQLRDEGVLASKSANIGPLMKASKDVLPWCDYALVDQGREQRNRIAHRREFLARAEVWRYIDGIECELIGWRVLDGPVRGEYSVTMRVVGPDAAV